MKRKKYILLIVSALILIGVGTLLVFYPISPSSNQTEEPPEELNLSGENEAYELHYVALGDSLTEGIGDETYNGGFVPRLSEQLEEHQEVSSINANNFGISGDTSDDLLRLLQNDEDVREDIERAQMISITIGANDLTRTLSVIGLEGTMDDFEDAYNQYVENLDSIFTEIRSLNSETRIYLFEYYNPFHYYLSEIEELNETFIHWNQAMEAQTEEDENAVFIELDSYMNPADREVANQEEIEAIETYADILDENHPYLYDQDHFHPNDEGFQLKADLLYEQVIQDIEENKLIN